MSTILAIYGLANLILGIVFFVFAKISLGAARDTYDKTLELHRQMEETRDQAILFCESGRAYWVMAQTMLENGSEDWKE